MTPKQERKNLLIDKASRETLIRQPLNHVCDVCLIRRADARIEDICGTLVYYICDDCWYEAMMEKSARKREQQAVK